MKEEAIVESSRTSLASKVKSLTSKIPTCSRPRIALFFDLLKTGQGRKNFTKNLRLSARRPFFSLENTCALCPWSLSMPVLGLERVCPQKVGNWSWPRMFFVSLASRLVSSTHSRVRLINMKL